MHSGYPLGALRLPSGCTLATLRVHSGYPLGALRLYRYAQVNLSWTADQTFKSSLPLDKLDRK